MKQKQVRIGKNGSIRINVDGESAVKKFDDSNILTRSAAKHLKR